MIRVLFVDDDVKLLQGLRRMLRSQRRTWDMSFAEGGEQALAALAEQEFDAIVTDMRMPGIDGAQLLTIVRDKYPKIARLVLSGQADSDAVLRSAGPAHRFLAKPCSMDELVAAVDSVSSICSAVAESSFGTLVAKVESIPSPPALLAKLLKQLNNPKVAIHDVAQLIGNDIGMSAKVIQLVNSSFFGLSQRITSAEHAASMLGLDTLRGLAMTTSVFSAFPIHGAKILDFDELVDHSLLVGQAAKLIAEAEEVDTTTVNNAVIAGMMHDVGKIVLAAHQPEAYQTVLTAARSEKTPVFEAEIAEFSIDHGQLGAYVLALWGIPASIVDAISLHHDPESISGREELPLALIIHTADALVHEFIDGERTPPALALKVLEEFGLEDRLDCWREALASDGRFGPQVECSRSI
jgi:putative nucleotidyltransferase with HDIG domain